MSSNNLSGKELVYSYDEMFLLNAILRETFLGIKLDSNEIKIIDNSELGSFLQKRISNLFKDKALKYRISFTPEEIVIVRNSLIIVMIEFNSRNTYGTRMGRTLDECLLLLRRIDYEMLNWNLK